MLRRSTTTHDPSRVVAAVLRAHPLAMLGLLLGVLYLPWIAAIPLDGTLEGNRLEAAREMLHSGDWLVPHLGGAVYLAKPPLHPWMLALASWPFGEVTLAIGRSVSAFATIATACLVFVWGRRELGARTGAFAALTLGCAVACAQKAVRAELESTLLLFTTLALLAFWNSGRTSAQRTALGWSAAAGLALGAAVLVKGPPALIVFLLAAIATCIPRERRRVYLGSAAFALGLALACALTWVLPVCERVGFDEAWQAFHQQFVERISHAGRTNFEPFWFYIPALLLGFLPATLCAPVLVLVRPGRELASERARSRAAFLWGWALLPPVVFSLSSGKETRYLLPTFPAWALLVAWGWTRARALGRCARWREGLVRALGFATWIVPVAWLFAGWWKFPGERPFVIAVALLALCARSAIAWSAREGRTALALVALVALVGTAKLAWAGTILEEQRRDMPLAEIAQTMDTRLEPGETWILVGPYRSWWHFLVNRPCLAVSVWSEVCTLHEHNPDARWVLAPAEAIPASAHELERVNTWTVDLHEFCLVRLR
jgi:4-amino-4-deoxy-L-arabinose transferase-like glycosyltransferase